MRPAFLALLLVANAIFDVGITVGSFGFYRDGWEFSFSDMITTLVVTNYSFLSSPLEFLLLAIFRQLTILFSVFLVKLGKSDKLRHKMVVYGSLGSLAHIVSVVKTAYLSEHLPSETSPGLLMNFWSTFLMTIIHLIVIFVVFKKQNAMYGRLDDQEAAENANPDPINETDNISTKEQLLSMWDLVKSNRKCFYFGFVFLIFLIAADLAYPATHGKVVATALAGDSVNVEFWLYVYGFLMFSQRAATEIMGYFKESAQAHTHNHVRQKLFGYIILQDMAFFDRNPSGELTSRISNDCKSISTGLSNHVWTFTQELATLILALPVMLFYSWKLTIVSTAALPLVLLSSNLYGPFQERLSEELTNNAAAENGTVTEGLSSIRTVRVLATEEFWISRYTNNTVAWLTTKLTSIRWAKIYKTVTSFMHRIEYLIMFGYATHLFGNNTMDIPTFLAFIFYQYQVEGALLELSELFPEVMETLGLSRKVMLLFKQQPLVPLNQGSATPEIVGNVVFENITFAYPTNPNKTVINGINFTIPEKKMTAFVGPSGGGKSTIVSLLNRCYPPSNGRILIDETPIQDFDHLFSGTIRENIVCGQVGVTEEDLREAARQAHALEFIVKLENGFDTECGERGTRLSGGEKQRIAIARALIRKPKVLILDEATSALDPVSEQKVKMALKECSVGRTVICIAHRLTSVRHADMIAFVSDGKIVEKGTHEELMGNADGEYHKLVMDHVNSML